MFLSVAGDTHGRLKAVREYIHHLRPSGRKHHPMLHLGDFGFADDYRSLDLDSVSTDRLMIVGGNHEEYPALVQLPCYLGDFGVVPGTSSSFFVRGANSIDKHKRIPGWDWWYEEQLSHEQMNAALSYYEEMKPYVVFSHDAPANVTALMFGRENVNDATSSMLEEMLSIHAPERWYFGHWHEPATRRVGATTFQCVGKMEIIANVWAP